MTDQPDQSPAPQAESGQQSADGRSDHDPLDVDPVSSVRAAAGRWLPLVSLVEFVSVLVLFGNRLTVHLDAITSVLGPVHGCLYLATIVCALLARVRWPVKVLAVLPVVGGLLATWYAARRPLAAPQPARGEASLD